MSQSEVEPDAPRNPWPILAGVSILVLALDQLTKWLIVRAFEVGDSTPVLGGIFYLTRRTNTGGAFSLFSGNAQILGVVNALVIVALIILAPRIAGHSRLLLLAIAMLIGGAVGNLIDRIINGYVVDFIDVYYHDSHWPAFNVADSAITGGVILLLLDGLLVSFFANKKAQS